MTTVAVVIPTIPPREVLLRRALESVYLQSRKADEVSFVVDHEALGATATRNAAAAETSSEWLAFLDDDDEFLPHHLETLLVHAEETGADYVFGDFVVPEAPWFRLDSYCYGEWDPAAPLQTTITVLVRRTLWAEVGGFRLPAPGQEIRGDAQGEDFDFTLRCQLAGGVISHKQLVTWYWHHHGANTSGRRWR